MSPKGKRMMGQARWLPVNQTSQKPGGTRAITRSGNYNGSLQQCSLAPSPTSALTNLLVSKSQSHKRKDERSEKMHAISTLLSFTSSAPKLQREFLNDWERREEIPALLWSNG
eukprot:RCo024570